MAQTLEQKLLALRRQQKREIEHLAKTFDYSQVKPCPHGYFTGCKPCSRALATRFTT